MNRWDAFGLLLYAEGAFFVLLFAGLPALVVALLLLGGPARRSPVLRTLARLLLAADAAVFAFMIVAGSLPFLADGWKALGTRMRTHHLAAPLTLAGAVFPAGSTVRLKGDGSLDRGTVPVPTVIRGLSLVGDFDVPDSWPAAIEGTLATPTVLGGVPCKADKVWWLQDDRMECLLDRDYAFGGLDFAAGQRISFEALEPGLRRLLVGTLAHAGTLFGVSWPAGSVVTGLSDQPDRLARYMAVLDDPVSVCLTPGATASMGGATLHGTLAVSVRAKRRDLSSGCWAYGVDYPKDGYAEVGADHYTKGQLLGGDAAWHWSNGGEGHAD